MTIKILLSDDHAIIRNGLRSLLSSHSEMEVIGEAKDGKEAIELAIKKKPNIVIMDISMPVMNGIEATREIISSCKGVKVIGLSMHHDKQFIIEMLKAGASGYVLKDSAFFELVTAIKTVLKNKKYLSGDLAGVVMEDMLSDHTSEKLSKRE
ncbi:MAG: response regulator transcription factor, partial [Deltaproteobacteria bacterium]|nr:response regulator transcription factor [Deltaproteobacteria bacterium]